MTQTLTLLRSLDGVLEVAPVAGDDFPAIALGDHFFYYAPDDIVPRRQPYATIITKNYPGDTASDLDRPGRWRLNLHIGRELADELIVAPETNPSAVDAVLRHPLYARQGWVAIVCPRPATFPLVERLLRLAHDDDRRRVTRSAG